MRVRGCGPVLAAQGADNCGCRLGSCDDCRMKLSRTERWILSNQLRILEGLNPKEAADLREQREALERGYEYMYPELCPHIYADKDCMPRAESDEVIEILSLFDTLRWSLEKAEDAGGLKAEDVRFWGFDGNSEGRQMAFCRYFCREGGGRFEHLERGDDFNSHFPALDGYRRMLAVWRAGGRKNPLPPDEVKAILAARRHPDA
ncbi:MAG: YfbU family protein [Myxococcaceae bacterium]|nr:MAG: YfbU family protein [Myxococcaceae bacterium]